MAVKLHTASAILSYGVYYIFYVYKLGTQKLVQIYIFSKFNYYIGSAFKLIKGHPYFSQANRLKVIATQFFPLC